MSQDDELCKRLNEETMKMHLLNAFKEYGIEGTEDKIKSLYCCAPKTREAYLAFYYKLIKKEI